MEQHYTHKILCWLIIKLISVWLIGMKGTCIIWDISANHFLAKGVPLYVELMYEFCSSLWYYVLKFS